jgi:mannose-6-phosphate isomerase-like protein (cupin superfamily)
MLIPLLLFVSLQAQIAQPPVIIWPHGVSTLGVKHKEDFGDHGLSITVHDKSGIAEVHQATADVMIVQSGEATLIYGGEVVDAKQTAPNEVRGPSIRNGTSVHVSTGDVIHFAAGVPHQWIIEPGKQITYLVVHIEQTSAKP